MSIDNRFAATRQMIREIELIVRTHMLKATQNCVNCENFDIDTEFCKLVKARPPASILVRGCEKYEELIPF